MSEEMISWVIIPIVIMLARIVDVSLGTIRIIQIALGKKLIASLIGFAECLLWLIAVSQIMQNLSNIFCYIGFALGFAIGNYIGIFISEKLPSGLQIIRIINNSKVKSLQMALRDEGFGVTTVDGYGAKGPVNLIYVVSSQVDVPRVMEIIKQMEPSSFVTINDVKSRYLGTLKPTSFLSGFFRK